MNELSALHLIFGKEKKKNGNLKRKQHKVRNLLSMSCEYSKEKEIEKDKKNKNIIEKDKRNDIMKR